MSATDRLDRFQQRHRAVGFPLAVVYKYFDDQGNFLAALITYYAFLSVFPFLLLGSSVLGFVLQGNPGLQERIVESALAQFPVIGDQLNRPDGLRGNSTAVVVGVLGSLYGALGVAQASQNAMNIAWAVPRNKRPNPVAARARSALLLVSSGIAIIATTILAAVGNNLASLGADVGDFLQVSITLASVLMHAGVFVLLFRLATTYRHSLRDAIPGALFTAVIWQLLQLLGSAFVEQVVREASVAYGVFAIALGMVAWIFLGAIAVVLGAEINVVRSRHLYPRSLLTIFVDDVVLTQADRRAYASYAKAQRHKDFQVVDVTFHGGDDESSGRGVT